MKVPAYIRTAETRPVAVAVTAAKASAIASGCGFSFHRDSTSIRRCRVWIAPWHSRDLRRRNQRSAPEQRRFADRQPECVAAQPVQRDLSGENLYPIAIAAQLIAARGLGSVAADQRDADRADRMLGGATVGAGYARRSRLPRRRPCARARQPPSRARIARSPRRAV